VQGLPEPRSIGEVTTRVVANYIFLLVNFGHYGSLLNLPPRQHVLLVCAVALSPLFSVGIICYLMATVFRAARREIRGSRQPGAQTDFSDITYQLYGGLSAHIERNSRQRSPDSHLTTDGRGYIPLFDVPYSAL
jgi:hypothetical protein